MLEKIPIGGWRHAESRVVEVFAGKAKTRDVVPNWPRGRSTSKRLAAGSDWPWQYAHSLVTGEVIAIIERDELPGLKRQGIDATVPSGLMQNVGPIMGLWRSKALHLDWAARTEDRVGEQAEERRKAEMMEGWYEQQRIEARGPLYPQKDDGFAVYRAKLDMLINEVKP